MNRLVIVGAGGHGKVIADNALENGYTDISFVDDNEVGDCMGYPILGTCDDIETMNDGNTDFIIGVGKNSTRKMIAEKHDVNWVTMTDIDTINPDIVLGTDVVIKTKFDNMIGGGAINPFVNPLIPDVVIGEEKATMLINGYSNAREYYELNPSSTGYGFYGALNGDMFVGDEGCDFIEVYFDVVKIKGETGWNYNFKVGLLNFLTAESVF